MKTQFQRPLIYQERKNSCRSGGMNRSFLTQIQGMNKKKWPKEEGLMKFLKKDSQDWSLKKDLRIQKKHLNDKKLKYLKDESSKKYLRSAELIQKGCSLRNAPHSQVRNIFLELRGEEAEKSLEAVVRIPSNLAFIRQKRGTEIIFKGAFQNARKDERLKCNIKT